MRTLRKGLQLIQDGVSVGPVEKPMCDKTPYNTRAMAEHAKRTINFNNKDRPIKRTYYCKECSAWHLTSQAKWKD